jgi:hypothetical protein
LFKEFRQAYLGLFTTQYKKAKEPDVLAYVMLSEEDRQLMYLGKPPAPVLGGLLISLGHLSSSCDIYEQLLLSMN